MGVTVVTHPDRNDQVVPCAVCADPTPRRRLRGGMCPVCLLRSQSPQPGSFPALFAEACTLISRVKAKGLQKDIEEFKTKVLQSPYSGAWSLGTQEG